MYCSYDNGLAGHDTSAHMKNLVVSVSVCLALLASSHAAAGSVEGPLVVWYNMSAKPEAVDKRVRDYLNSAQAEKDCWTWGALMFMRSKPAAINRELVDRAVLQKDRKAIAKLNGILKKPFGEADHGFDGIVVYSDEHGARYDRLTTGERRIETRGLAKPEDAAKSLCAVLPPITRAP